MGRPIKIAYVIGQLSIGGSERQLLELVRNLNPQKFQVVLICLSGEAALSALFREAGCDVRHLHRETRGRLLVLWELAEIFRKVQPDIVHSYAYASRAAIPVSKIFSKCKNIVSIRTQPEWQVNWWDRFLNSFADLILTNSKKAAESVHFGFQKIVPCRVVYNGIDLQKFGVNVNGSHTLALPLNSNARVVCVVARLHPVKGLDVLLDAFAIISNVADDIHLWIAGDGPDREKLGQQADQLGIGSRVFFLGQQENISSILGYVDVGVLSSHVEGLPNAIIEYMAAHLPVVATNAGGISELITHDWNGFLVEPNNPDQLAQAILVLLKNPELAERFGENGRLFVEKNFDIKKMVSETEKIYLELCPQK